MAEVSRRGFLSGKVFVDLRNETSIQTVVNLGNIKRFQVNTVTEVVECGVNYFVHSLPLGIKLMNHQTGQTIKLSLESDGCLYAHTKEFWRDDTVLSLLTGEPYLI